MKSSTSIISVAVQSWEGDSEFRGDPGEVKGTEISTELEVRDTDIMKFKLLGNKHTNFKENDGKILRKTVRQTGKSRACYEEPEDSKTSKRFMLGRNE